MAIQTSTVLVGKSWSIGFPSPTTPVAPLCRWDPLQEEVIPPSWHVWCLNNARLGLLSPTNRSEHSYLRLRSST